MEKSNVTAPTRPKRIVKDYFVDRDRESAIKLQVLLKDLPDFCADFFVGIELTTSPLTRLNYAYDLRVFFNYLIENTHIFKRKTVQDLVVEDLERIKANHIERFLSFISNYETDENRRVSNGEQGKARKLSTLKTFFKYYFKKDLISSNVVSKVDSMKLHEKPIIRLETDEVARFLDCVDDGSCLTKRQKDYHLITRMRDMAIITLMLGTGIRVSECVGLNIKDVDFNVNGLSITRKGGNKDIVYFSDEVKEALVNYMDERMENPDAQDDPALFLSLQNKRISVRAVEILVKKYAAISTPLKHITPHKLRSTYGTALYHETQDIYVVANVLGHKDVNTTRKHYAAMAEDIKRSVASKVKLRDD